MVDADNNCTKVYLPGQILPIALEGGRSIKIGRGLTYRNHSEDSNKSYIVSTQAGQLIENSGTNGKNNKQAQSQLVYYLRSNAKRYSVKQGDLVIGIIEERSSEYYRVNIFGSHPGILPALAFEGATKRNRPYLDIGSIVYCRVQDTFNGDMDPLLTCKVHDSSGSKSTSSSSIVNKGVSAKDWMTNEGTFGELRADNIQQTAVGGTQQSAPTSTLSTISLGLARVLLDPANIVLLELGKKIAFEIVIGVNGVIWVKSKTAKETILIINAIKNSEVMDPAQTKGMVNSLITQLFNNNGL